MNIIYMHTHDTGRFVQPYGHPVPTPHLMNLAQQGTLFRHAYCASPACSPSRSALLTGMAPHSSGMLGLAHRGFQLNDYDRHLSRFLRGKGLETVLCGVQHETVDQTRLGYQKILDQSDASGQDPVAEDIRNAKRVAQYLTDKQDQPFFLSFGMFNTHRDFPAIADDINPDYVMPPFPLYDTPQNRTDMAAYLTSAKIMDQCVGIVMEALRQSGKEEDTLIIFTTDHGIPFPRMKCTLHDAGIGVSLILKFPMNPRQGKAVDALVSQIDLFPTICDFLNMEKPDWLQGESMMPLLMGESDRIRNETFAEVTFHAAYEPMRCIRTERYKLIRFYDDHNQLLPVNIEDSPSKDFLLVHGYFDGVREKEMLFDLYLDPVERVNVREDARYQTIYRDLSDRLERWMKETDDPLLSGRKVNKPEGARVNKLQCISPYTKEYE